DVGVAQPGACLRFPEEAGAEFLGDLDLARDHFQCPDAIEDRVMGLEDHAHAPTADALENLVPSDLLGHQVIWGRRSRATRRPRTGSWAMKIMPLLPRPIHSRIWYFPIFSDISHPACPPPAAHGSPRTHKVY